MKTLTELYSDRGRFMITAHRGASFEFPENTAHAMRKAVEAGADMIEFDLRGTADGVPVLLHDETIDRTSDGRGMPEEHSLDELKKLNFSFWLQGMRREAPVTGRRACWRPHERPAFKSRANKVAPQVFPKTCPCSNARTGLFLFLFRREAPDMAELRPRNRFSTRWRRWQPFS